MIATSLRAFANDLRQFKLLEPKQLDALALDCFPDPRPLARHLLGRGWLTAYQANQLLLGRGASLLLGQYLLLERLGEGGMGQVFKARHLGLQRLVALKMLPGGVAAHRELAERFRREVRALSQLNHPNIVQVLDADELGGDLFFVMEYVDGSDLSRLVKQQGALPISVACDCIRQAALGLQHIHERGLVHRDLKPANLLTTNVRGARPGEQVKILDLGLARLRFARTEDESATLTQAGTVLGTPDYLAPEQALNAHSADIRADLYSLGCTLYFLLTGKVPFPAGTPLEKLFQHRLQSPPAVNQLRPDVPAWLAAILNRLLAKHPEDRYQTPAELAVALSAGVDGAALLPVAKDRAVIPTTATLWDGETVLTAAQPSPAGRPRSKQCGNRSMFLDQAARLVAGPIGWLRAWKRSLQGG